MDLKNFASARYLLWQNMLFLRRTKTARGAPGGAEFMAFRRTRSGSHYALVTSRMAGAPTLTDICSELAGIALRRWPVLPCAGSRLSGQDPTHHCFRRKPPVRRRPAEGGGELRAR